MTLKLIQKALTQYREKCPNCEAVLFVLTDNEGRVFSVNQNTLVVMKNNRFRCSTCSSVLEFTK